jgi:hypothetical protein
MRIGLAHNRAQGHGIDAFAFVLTKCFNLHGFRVWGNPAICGPTLSATVCQVET